MRATFAEGDERSLGQDVAVDDGREAERPDIGVGCAHLQGHGCLDQVIRVRTGQQLLGRRGCRGGGAWRGILARHGVALHALPHDVAQERDVLRRPSRRQLGRVDRIGRWALGDRPGEQPARRRRRHERRDRVAARRLAEHRHTLGIPAEGGDVLSHPTEQRDLVAQPEVALEPAQPELYRVKSR